jgi:hypothetical protein
MVAAPLRNGHRSLLAGEAEWRHLQTRDAAAIQGTRERATMLKRTSNSPRVRRSCRRDLRWSASPD